MKELDNKNESGYLKVQVEIRDPLSAYSITTDVNIAYLDPLLTTKESLFDSTLANDLFTVLKDQVLATLDHARGFNRATAEMDS